MTHPTPPNTELADKQRSELEAAIDLTPWQKVRFGDTPQSRASIAYWRERSWPVDNVNMPQDVEDRIYSFMAGWEQARSTLTPRPAQDGFDKFVEMLDREPQYKPRLAALLKEHAAQTQDSGNEGEHEGRLIHPDLKPAPKRLVEAPTTKPEGE